MTPSEVRQAIDKCKEVLTPERWAELTTEQRTFLCRVIHTSAEDVDIVLAAESLEHPLQATIKKHRGLLKRKFFLDGVLKNSSVNKFETKEQAYQFAKNRGIEIVALVIAVVLIAAPFLYENSEWSF